MNGVPSPMPPADEIFGRATSNVDLDDEIVFDEAEGLDNPLAVPLVAALRMIRKVRNTSQGWRLLALEALTALGQRMAQLDQARRTIASLRVETVALRAELERRR